MSNAVPKFMRNRHAEIQEHLLPLVKELGLERITVTRSNRHDGYEVFFQGPEPARNDSAYSFSPVSIIFNREGSTDLPEADWRECGFAIEDWRSKPLGKTGWSHRRCWDEKLVRVDAEGSKLFSWIKSRIRAEGVVHVDPNSTEFIQSTMLADVYWEIRREIRDLGIVRIPGKFEEQEALTFLGHNGRRVHMRFPTNGNFRGTVLLDGDEMGDFTLHRLNDVVGLAHDLSKGDSQNSVRVSTQHKR